MTCDVTAHHVTLTTAALADYDPNTRVWPRCAARPTWRRCGLLGSGVIDAVVSDHQPHHLEDKAHEFLVAASGVSALETVVPLLLERVASGDRPCGAHPTPGRWPHGQPRPGASEQEGHVADLTIVDPNRTWTVTLTRS